MIGCPIQKGWAVGTNAKKNEIGNSFQIRTFVEFCKKVSHFPVAIKLSLAGNNKIIACQGEFGW
jgi:hypothetical protein